MKKITKDFFHLDTREKKISYCILFTCTLILLFFGDQIIMQFIKAKPNDNDSIFGQTEKKDYQIDFLKPITLKEAEEKIANQESFLILSSRSKCETCEKYLPTIKELQETYQLAIYYIDRDKVDENSNEFLQFTNHSEQLQNYFRYTPYLMAFNKGNFEEGWVGKKEKEEIEEYIKNFVLNK